ncbi:MAG TPA: methionine--tRNA ligase [Candidatus Peribacteraceae bacterium]|nr:methionine--tRNA ligase [Candidatus Peribacteraceae bacterium]
MSRQYITTAIDYPNAAPHMGHVLEKVIADVMARWFRLKGDEVRFQIGTDEHGIKIQQTAKKAGATPSELVDQNVPLFESLYAQLNISADIFIRTSDHAVNWPNVDKVRHRPTVEALWKKLMEAGALEKRTYTGLYCSGCERFLTAKDLVDGKCPIHQVEPEKVEEENYFFKLHDKEEWLQKILTDGEYRIIPDYRSEETLSLIRGGLEDVSFSRPKSSLAWGIPIPGDENQTMYVWCDALTNYISGLGYLTDREEKKWWDDATVTHVIGKDIARFHACIWPAMLNYAGIQIPNRLLIHGFVTSEGQKMSKSLGNVVDPVDVLATFNGNPDPMRFFLCHEIPVGRDGDFSWKRLEEIYDSKLRNQLGNMLNRVLVMLKKEGGSLALPPSKDDEANIAAAWVQYADALNRFDIHGAIQGITTQIDAMNASFNLAQPWKLEGTERIAVLSRFAEALRHVSLALLPFIPDTAYRIARQLNLPYVDKMKEKDFVITDAMKTWGGVPEWKTVGEPSILFAPLD